MSDEENKVVQQEVQEPVENQVEEPVENQVEEPPKTHSDEGRKITAPPKKKEKDPKKVAQGKRLAQISERAKKEKMRREIEEENQIDFSVNYRTLLYFGLVPLLVFSGFYLHAKSRETKSHVPQNGVPKTQETKNDATPQPTRKHVSLFD